MGWRLLLALLEFSHDQSELSLPNGRARSPRRPVFPLPPPSSLRRRARLVEPFFPFSSLSPPSLIKPKLVFSFLLTRHVRPLAIPFLAFLLQFRERRKGISS